MPLTSTADRAHLIEQLALAVARHRMYDTRGMIPAEQIVTREDRALVLSLLRKAAPLYPLPVNTQVDAQAQDVNTKVNKWAGCRCWKQMGNDFWFLPTESCLYGTCDNPLPKVDTAENHRQGQQQC
jgi:hypothetical protein